MLFQDKQIDGIFCLSFTKDKCFSLFLIVKFLKYAEMFSYFLLIRLDGIDKNGLEVLQKERHASILVFIPDSQSD